MTIREFLQAIIENENVEQELKEFANERILKLDEKNSKRKVAPSKTQIENAKIKEDIIAFLKEQGENQIILANNVAEALEISTPKASALLGQLEKTGMAVSKEVKVSKVGKRLAWNLVSEDNE